MRASVFVCSLFLLPAATAAAVTPAAADESPLVTSRARNIWHVEWGTPEAQPTGPVFRPLFPASPDVADLQTSAPPQAAVEYSDAYKKRAKLHRYSSFAMLPLFATEIVMGQSLYNSSSDGKKTAHIVVGSTIVGLFGINTVTGVWNLIEARKDAHGRGRRLAHGLLMLAADAGFLTTVAVAPGDDDSADFSGAKSTHRAVAFTSFGLASAGYLIMLFGGR
jgi:hypothetical protein